MSLFYVRPVNWMYLLWCASKKMGVMISDQLISVLFSNPAPQKCNRLWMWLFFHFFNHSLHLLIKKLPFSTNTLDGPRLVPLFPHTWPVALLISRSLSIMCTSQFISSLDVRHFMSESRPILRCASGFNFGSNSITVYILLWYNILLASMK